MAPGPDQTATVSPGDAFTWPVRVYYEDTDAGGVVYHAAYLKFFERARTEWLRHLGFDQSRVRIDDNALFAVRSMQIEFIRPARFDDMLAVSVRGAGARRASFRMAQAIRRQDGELLCEASVRVACVDASTFAPRAVPEKIRNALVGS